MKKTTSIILILSLFVLFSGCGNTKVIDGFEYDTYGLFNGNDERNPDIEYRLIIGNVVWSVIFCETIVVPLYFFGFSLYEPVGKLDKDKPKGAI